MPKKPSLGKGLDAVFLDNEMPATGDITQLRTAQVEPNPTQPRKAFDTAKLEQLADSISAHGLIQPIAVRESNKQGFYEIVAGERRWRAAKMAGITEIPVVILDLSDADAAQVALIENIQRQDLNPIEEAQAYQALMEQYDMTQEGLSRQLGKSRSSIANMLRLLELPDSLQEKLASGELSTGHAKIVLSVKDSACRQLLAEEIIKRNLSVRAAEALAKKLSNGQKKADGQAEADRQEAAYYQEIEERVTSILCRKVRIVRGKTQKIEISVSDNRDMETLIKRLCGNDFFDRDP